VKAVLIAAVISLVAALFGTPMFIKFLVRRGYGQFIRDDGPTSHHTKRGTPTMGGAVIIAASLLALGLMVIMEKHLPFGMGVVLTALFGAFHGFAHGAEIPASTGGLSYALGFVAATIMIQAAGVTLGTIQTNRFSNWAKAAGAGVATVGAILLVAA